MGSDASATLFFGFELPHDELPPWRNEEEDDDEDGWFAWEDRVLEKVLGPEPDYDTERAAWERHLKKKDAALRDLAVELVHWGGDYDPHFAVSFTPAEKSASWDGLTPIDPEHFNIDRRTAIEKLRTFCDLLGLECKEPRWYLAADYR